MDDTDRVFQVLSSTPGLSSTEIAASMNYQKSTRTLVRLLDRLIAKRLVVKTGTNKGTRYALSESYRLLHSIDIEDYFTDDIDDRQIIPTFNHSLLSEELHDAVLFTDEEFARLSELQERYRENIAGMPEAEYSNEIERLAIDLSWKSSQIEGNTYSLLETERLLKEKQTAAGKSKDEAVMLLNHKEAIDFVLAHPDYLATLSTSKIEDIHSLLTKELGINRNLRRRRVGITGTNYRPLENEFQIKEAFGAMCKLINAKATVFEKALLALVLISYIQGFADGNKRTARITSNGILVASQYCPISFRTVDSIDYKKAMLIFYEQNNITAFKRIFIEQFEFAVRTYF